MVTRLQLKIAGYGLLGIATLAFLWGLCTWAKFFMATGFIGALIGIALLYYSSQMLEEK